MVGWRGVVVEEACAAGEALDGVEGGVGAEDLAVLAESAGFDDFWLADERFFREVYACLTLCALRTRRIRLGPCVYCLPLYDPLRLIEEICMLDHMSGGRLEIGFGGAERLIAQAQAHPGMGFIGCEPFVNGMAKALSLIEQLLRAIRNTSRS